MNIRLNLSVLTIAMAMILATGSGNAKEHDHATHDQGQQMQHQEHAQHQDHEQHAQHQEHGQHMQHQEHEKHAQHQDHMQHDGAGMAGSDDPHVQHRAMLNKPAKAAKSTRVDLRDRQLLDQHGKQVGFVSDVIGDNIVVMDFVYTTCTTICPVLTAVMGQVQGQLGDSLGSEVALVSVTVDSTRDTPQRLKAYADNHGAKQGWSWLTGPKTAVDDVLTGLGAYSPNFEDHAPMVLVGDGRTGEWSRFFGFPNADRIIEQVNTLRASRNKMAGG